VFQFALSVAVKGVLEVASGQTTVHTPGTTTVYVPSSLRRDESVTAAASCHLTSASVRPNVADTRPMPGADGPGGDDSEGPIRELSDLDDGCKREGQR
jgi:hypothetical protein